MDHLADDFDTEIINLRDAGWDNDQISIWVRGEVKAYNGGSPNPHPIKLGELNKYLAGRGLPTFRGRQSSIV